MKRRVCVRAASVLLVLLSCTSKRDLGNVPDGGGGVTGSAGTGGQAGSGAAGSGTAGDGAGGRSGSGGGGVSGGGGGGSGGTAGGGGAAAGTMGGMGGGGAGGTGKGGNAGRGGSGSGGSGGAGGTSTTGGAGGSGGAGGTSTAGSGGSGGAGGTSTTGGAGGSGAAGTGGAGAGGAAGSSCGGPSGPASTPCAGVRCSQPPADACVDAMTLRHYDADGICVRGDCRYAYRDAACAGGCAGGVCQANACGAASCNMPPAPVCADAMTLNVPPALGTCSSNSCSYAGTQVVCSEGCMGQSCQAASDITEKAIFDTTSATSVAFALDTGNQARFASCEQGTLRYRFRDATGWRVIDVESNLGANCEVAMTLNGSNRARLAYHNSAAGLLRFAEETAPGTFALDTAVFNHAYGLALASTPSGDPIIAHVTGLPTDGNHYLSVVSRTGTSWAIQVVTGPNSALAPATQMAVAPDGAVHIVNGSPNTAGEIYARRRGQTQTWDVRTLSTSLAGRALALDAQGNVAILGRMADPTYPGKGNYPVADVLWTFDATGTNLVAERVTRTSSVSTDLPPFLLPDAYGEVRVAYPGSGTALRRLGWEIWAPVGGVYGFSDVRVGSDGVPRYLVPASPSTIKKDDLVQPICRPSCSGNDCGPDGCGGVCGVCGGCAACGEEGHCSAIASERITRLPGEPIPTAAPAANVAVLTPEGRIMITSNGTAAVGTTGSWSAFAPLPTNSSLNSGGGQLYAVAASGGAISRWNGTTWQSFANPGIAPTISYIYVAVDGAAQVHLAYSDPIGSSPQRIMHIRVSASGVVGAPEVIVMAASATNNRIALQGLAAGTADVLHYTYQLGTINASSNFDYTYRHTVRGAGSWPETVAPAGMRFSYGLVDAQGTVWYVMIQATSTFPPPPTGGYATRTAIGQWTFPTISGTTFQTRKTPALGVGLLFSPSGGVYAANTNNGTAYYKLDLAADSWTQIASGIGSAGVFDAQGTLHSFSVDAPAGVDHLRHWWFTPP